MKTFSLTVVVALAPLTVAAHDHATAHYLGNEGVMIERGETKIVFDAFYAQSFGQYALVPRRISDAMMKGDAPYDGVDAIFVSHVHGDHFSPKPTVAYLRAQQDVVMFAPQQVKDRLAEYGVAEDDPLMERVRALALTPQDAAETMTIGDIAVDVVSIPHAGNRPHIQNYAWRVSLGPDTTVVHLGDADTKVSNFSRHQAHFDKKTTHAAFPPYWFVGDENGELVLSDIIKAKQTIGVHVPKRAAGRGDKWRKKAGGDLFTDPGETRSIVSD
jgi:L-ascorbate metabolism protein UlaG (beta-lactamase superfamily)